MRIVSLLLIAFVGVFLGFSTPAHSQDSISAYEFSKPSELFGLVISPNGRFLAFKQTENAKFCLTRNGQMQSQEKAKCKDKNKVYRTTYKVIIYDYEAKKVAKTFALPENFYPGWIEFVSDKKILLKISRSTTFGRRSYSLGGSRIIAIDFSAEEDSEENFVTLFDGNNRVERNNRYLSRVVNMLRDDPDHVIMPASSSHSLDLWKVNVNTGEAVRTEKGKSGTFYWYTNRNGVAVLRFDCKGHRCRKVDVFSRDKLDSDWKKIRSFEIKPDDDEKDYDFWPVAPTDNENQFYVISDDEKDERRAIKIYDIKKEVFVKTVFEHETYDVSNVLTTSDTGEYGGAIYYDDTIQYVIEDKLQQKHYDAIRKYFKNKANVSIIGYTENGDRAVVFVSSPGNIGTYYIYHYEDAYLQEIFQKEPTLSAQLNSDADILKLPMRDGTSITGYHFYPKGHKRSSLPLIIMPHGGPEIRDTFSYDVWTQYFVAHGYQVLKMNFRGSSGYGRTFAERGYGEWGGLMQDDVTDSVKYFHDNGLATPDKTCIIGYSYGGYAALQGGVATPELYACVVSGGGLSDLILSMKNEKKDHGKKSEAYEYWAKSKGDPKTEKDKLYAASPANFADQMQAPVLLIHGEYDGNVDIKQSKRMEKALKNAGKEVEFLMLEDEGHSNWSLENDVLYLETIKAFLDKHIGQ